MIFSLNLFSLLLPLDETSESNKVIRHSIIISLVLHPFIFQLLYRQHNLNTFSLLCYLKMRPLSASKSSFTLSSSIQSSDIDITISICCLYLSFLSLLLISQISSTNPEVGVWEPGLWMSGQIGFTFAAKYLKPLLIVFSYTRSSF